MIKLLSRHVWLFLILLCFCETLYAQGELWGITSKGGKDGMGTIYKTNTDGTGLAVQYEFSSPASGGPGAKQFSEFNQRLYGVGNGGKYGLGVIYEYDPATNGYVKKFDFSSLTGGGVTGKLTKATNNKLYGMTNQRGGVDGQGRGSIYEYDPVANTATYKFLFAASGNQNDPNGAYPTGNLVAGLNGKVYGRMQSGSNGYGYVFEYDANASSFTRIIEFDGANKGSSPNELFFSSTGKLYGTTNAGGINSKGVLFQYDPSTAVFTKLIDFDGTNSGSNPASLMEATNGKFYGLTTSGGANNKGVLYEYNVATATYTKKIDFTGTNGANPVGTMVQASNGKLYGLTPEGQNFSPLATIFEFDPSTDILQKKLDFPGFAFLVNGSLSLSSVNGKLYGTSSGDMWNGFLFEFDPSTSTYTKKLDLNAAPNGSSPVNELTLASNGKLYGVTSLGGINNQGVLFEFDRTSLTFTKRLDFSYATTGAQPGCGLVEANGKLYGMAGGGSTGAGVIFEYDPVSFNYQIKFSLGGTNGNYSYDQTMIKGTNGKLYGTLDGPASGYNGVLFEFDPVTSTFVKKYEMPATNNSIGLGGSLMQASNGKLYGTFAIGGVNNLGGIFFDYDLTTSTFTKRYDFTYYLGIGKPIQSSNGKIYGYGNSSGGGASYFIYEFDTQSNTLTPKYNLNYGNAGQTPFGSLVDSGSGKLYGFADGGIYGTYQGPGGYGTIYEYDPVTNIATKKFDFDGDRGASPAGQFLVIRANQTITFNTIPSKGYADPQFNLTASSNSGLPVSYTSSNQSVATVNGQTVTIVGIGTTVITAIQNGDVNYSPATAVQQTLVVSKSTLTATADSKAKTYGDINPNLTITYTGFKSSEDASVLDTPPSIATVAVTTSNTGTYPITISGGVDNNYTITLINGTLTINQAVLTATAVNASKIYGDANPSFIINYTGFKGADDATVIDTPPTASTTATITSNVSSYPITLSGGVDNNYSFTLANGSLSITKATLTATAANKSKVYGDVNPALTFSYTGFKGTDNSSVIDTPPTISTAASQASNAGSYAISLAGGTDNNYTITRVNGTFTVSKATLTATADAQTKIYGDPNPTLTITYTGFKLTDNASVIDAPPTISTTAVQTSNVGTYSITLAGGTDNNYTITRLNSNLTITQALLIATADDKSRPYNTANPTLTITYSGFKGTDNASVIDVAPTISTTATQTTPVGAYPIALSGGADVNYSLTLVNGTFTIVIANQTISFSLPVKNYGDAPFALAATASSGLPISYTISNDPSVATLNNGVVTIVGAGTAVITASQAGDNNNNPAPDVQQTLTVLLPKPTIPSSYVFLINEYATQVDLVTLTGNGNARLVVVKKDGPIDFVPVDNTAYTVGQTVGTNNDNIIGLVLNGTAFSGTIKNLQPGATYYFDVFEFNKSNNYYSYLTTATATGGQITMPQETVQVITPINNSVNQNAPTLSITTNTIAGATTYTVELYTNSQYTGTPIVRSGSTVTQSFTGLAYSTQYFARAKTDLSPNYGPGTTFTMEPPEADAYVTSPANGSTGNLVNLTVTSNAVAGATTYYIDISTISDFSSNVISKSGATAGLSFTGLAFNTIYYARVKTNLSANYGAVKSFVTADPLSISYVVTPANNATAQAISLNVTANTLTGASSYTIQLSPDQTFATGVISKSGSTPTANFTGLYYNTKYYNRVTSDLTPGQWGAVRNFTTRDHVLTTGPGNGATNVNYRQTLVAATISGASFYSIEANTASDFTGTSILLTGAATQTFTLAYNTQYYVRVSCNLASGWGSTRTFTTGDPYSLAYVTSPANGGTSNYTSQVVTANSLFGATSYTIELNTNSSFTGTSIVLTGSTNAITFTGLTPGTTYYTRVKTNITGYPNWGTTLTNFTSVLTGGRVQTDVPPPPPVEVTPFDVMVLGNPFRDKLHVLVTSPEQQAATIKLIDMTGRRAIELTAKTNELLDIENQVSPGLYILHVVVESKTKSVRVVRID